MYTIERVIVTPLQRFLDKNQISQAELARRADGMQQPQMNAYATGSRTPSAVTGMKIHKATGCKLPLEHILFPDNYPETSETA